jgi:hypothetical protein
MLKRQWFIFCCTLLGFLAVNPASAATARDSFEPLIKAMDKAAAKHKRDVATEKLAHKFQPFIVSQQSAELLMNSLQNRQTVALRNSAAGKIETFKPASKPMSLANVYVALSLAKLNLAQYGISQPTPLQIKCALNGGEFEQSYLGDARRIHLQGVLKLRAKRLGWEAIAKHIGVNPDPVRYEMQAANFLLTRRTVIPSFSAIKAFPEDSDDGGNSSGLGIFTAAGASAQP